MDIDITARLAGIDKADRFGDSEQAHILEDSLMHDLIRACSEGVDVSAACRTFLGWQRSDLDRTRWFA